jgi:hypothetical protein
MYPAEYGLSLGFRAQEPQHWQALEFPLTKFVWEDSHRYLYLFGKNEGMFTFHKAYETAFTFFGFHMNEEVNIDFEPRWTIEDYRPWLLIPVHFMFQRWKKNFKCIFLAERIEQILLNSPDTPYAIDFYDSVEPWIIGKPPIQYFERLRAKVIIQPFKMDVLRYKPTYTTVVKV